MQVHEVVYNSTLQVVLDTVYNDLLADVHDFEICVVALVAVTVDRLVDFLVLADTPAKVVCGLLGILVLVIGAASFDIEDVGHDDLFLVAERLYEENFDAICLTDLVNPFATVLCGIGGIENADNAAGAEPAQHVGDGRFGSGAARALTGCIVKVEKVGGGMGRIAAPVVADVEGLGRDRQPLEIALGCMLLAGS